MGCAWCQMHSETGGGVGLHGETGSMGLVLWVMPGATTSQVVVQQRDRKRTRYP